MAADGGASHAAQVCYMCKTRKKKCDKVLPCCGYCVRKGLDCIYGARPSPPNLAFAAAGSSTHPPSDILLEPSITETNIYLQAHRIIRATGQYVDDISVGYFQGFHRFLPVISRARFHGHLITLGATPTADFSVLLLAICLITFSPDVERRARHGNSASITRKSLHLAARSLFAQVQISASPSLHLIQAGLLLATYDYAHGQPEDAFASIAGCARMAYAAGIHVLPPCRPQLPPTPQTPDFEADIEPHLQNEEATNTWWGIVISERLFVCDVRVPEQPLISVVPQGGAPLPFESSILEQRDSLDSEPVAGVPVSSLFTVEVGSFARAAQAACLLDQVLKAFSVTDPNARLIELDGLSVSLQSLLAAIMQQYRGQTKIFCGAIATAIRALFTLHCHIIPLTEQPVTAKFRSQEDWRHRSQLALESVTQMCVDIADHHRTMPPHLVDSMALGWAYIVRASLRNIHGNVGLKTKHSLQSAEELLQTSLSRACQRWSMSGFYG